VEVHDACVAPATEHVRNIVRRYDPGGAGAVQGYRIDSSNVHPLNGSNVSLGLGNANPPFFLASPGQVAFTPDGSHLVVTTKASTSSILVFGVQADGRLGAPVTTASATPVPFGVSFDAAGHLLSAEAGGSNLSTYTINPDGSLGQIASVPDGQAALCWVAEVGGYAYVANAGSASISGYSVAASGTPSLIGVVGSTETGAIDLTGSSDGQFLYAESGGAGTIDEFALNADGTLTKLGSVAASPGLEGIAAT